LGVAHGVLGNKNRKHPKGTQSFLSKEETTQKEKQQSQRTPCPSRSDASLALIERHALETTSLALRAQEKAFPVTELKHLTL
jgi:hypothetical protein